MTDASTWFEALHEALRQEQACRSVTVIGPAESPLLGRRWMLPSTDGATGSATAYVPGEAPRPATAAELAVLSGLPPGDHAVDLDGSAAEVFVESHQPPPRLVIVGAVHIAEHLVHFARRLGFRCIVVDARAAFATPERFGHADELVVGWPGDVVRELPLRTTTYCACLTHDPKLDDPVLVEALRVGVRYLGALGSTRTHAGRLERLRQEGFDDEALARIDAPIGLDLGGRRPEEIALAIAARLVRERARAESE